MSMGEPNDWAGKGGRYGMLRTVAGTVGEKPGLGRRIKWCRTLSGQPPLPANRIRVLMVRKVGVVVPGLVPAVELGGLRMSDMYADWTGQRHRYWAMGWIREDGVLDLTAE
jgi:hypothetical protein